MSVLETLSDQMCCNTAVAVEALADAGDLGFVAVVGGQSVDAPALGAVSNPSLFTVGRSNPNTGLLAAVVNEQGPLGFELGDVAVGDLHGSNRVDNEKIVFSQDQFRSNPEQGCCGAESGCCGNVNGDIAVGGWVEKNLNQVQGVEEQRDSAPNQIALRAINRQVLHLSIIAGTPAGGEGK